MSQEAMRTLVERWTGDATFRAQMRQDPQAAIRDSGLNLTNDEMAAVTSIASENLSDQELQSRVSKYGIHV
jgi:putative modified peptide